MRSRWIASGLLAAGVLALACGGDEDPKPSGAPLARGDALPAEERGENQPPVVERVLLHPARPLPGNRIEARIDVSDADGDPIRLSLEWRQAGRVIGSGAQTHVTPERLHKGDEVQVVVTATDGRDESEPVRATTTVGNRAPLIQALNLAPDSELQPGQSLTAAPQGQDADGDPLEYEFEWWLNGRVVRDARAAVFDTSALRRGDRLQAKVRVTDGEEWSPLAESIVLELANRPPKIAGVPAIEAVAGGIHADLQAEDPDGDKSLRFRLIEGPQGLSVDSMSGRVSWKPAAGTTGTHPVEVAVADSFGAESKLRFELTVSAAPTEQADPAPPAKQKTDDDEDDEFEE